MLDYPKISKGRLAAEERQLATIRLLHDRKVTTNQAARILDPWEAVKAAVIDPKTWFFTMLYVLGNGSATISYLIPTILKALGYPGTTARWMTVPVWVIATVFLLVFPRTSD